MDTESTRQYSLPIPVSSSTAAHYRQYKNTTSNASAITVNQLGAIPDSQELLTIKSNFKCLLPHSEARMRFEKGF
ncbi:unnamed protein product [Cunninghamella blakesleeana]